MRTAAMVRARKEAHPEQYCRVPRCLWRTGGKYGTPCRNHPDAGAPAAPPKHLATCKCYECNLQREGNA